MERPCKRPCLHESADAERKCAENGDPGSPSTSGRSESSLVAVQVFSLVGDTVLQLQLAGATTVACLLEKIRSAAKTCIRKELSLILDTETLQSDQVLGDLRPGATELHLTLVTGTRHLAVCGKSNGTLQVWDLSRGSCLQHSKAHAGTVSCLEVDWRSLRALTGGADGAVCLWESIKDSTPAHKLLAHMKCVSSVRADWPSQRGLSSGVDGKLILWDLMRGEVFSELNAHEEPVSCLAVRWASEEAVSGSWDGHLRLWHFESGKLLKDMHQNEPISCVSVGWDAKVALSGTKAGMLCLWNLESGNCTGILRGHLQRISCISVDWTRLQALSASWDGRLSLWNLVDASKIIETPEQTHPISSMAVHWTLKQVVYGSWDGSLKMSELLDMERANQLPSTGSLGDGFRIPCIDVDWEAHSSHE